jgi:hypothetical protein
MRILKTMLLIKITTTEMPLYNGCRVYFPELNRPGRDDDRPTPSSMEVWVFMDLESTNLLINGYPGKSPLQQNSRGLNPQPVQRFRMNGAVLPFPLMPL